MHTTILDHHNETPTVTVFTYEKPPGFTYQPGQFINIELNISDCDNRCNKRNFSLLSIPSDEFLMTATRHGVSKFKHTFEQLKKGDQFSFTGPFGHFTLNEEPNIPAIMLSGGIGITPLHAMTKYAAYKNLPKPITLIYSNNSADDIPFKDDLDEYHESDMDFSVYYTITGEPPPDWKGKVGKIDEAMIKGLVTEWQISEYYICGPAQMVLELKKLVAKMGTPLERIKSEMFTGY